jgi:hypothetical protein
MSHKLYARSMPCVLLGYPADYRGYRCLDLHLCRVITSRHVIFNKIQFRFLSSHQLAMLTTARRAIVSDDTVLLQPQPTQQLHISPSRHAHYSSPISISAAEHPGPSSADALIGAAISPTITVSGTVPPHPMLTRACASIHKPNPKYAPASSTIVISPLPSSDRTALKDPNYASP